MTTYHKINSASKEELKQIAIQTAELNQKMYVMLDRFKAFTEDMHSQQTEITICESVELNREVKQLLAEARGEI